jgi:hypothetical protein
LHGRRVSAIAWAIEWSWDIPIFGGARVEEPGRSRGVSARS